MDTYEFNRSLLTGELHKSPEEILEFYESKRRKEPVVYNIETTNACNMTCKMCPRTTMMTRKVETLNFDTFKKVVDQLQPWSQEEWLAWTDFATRTYGINPDDMSENHFFLYVITKVIQLHGYGDPLLDKNISKAVQLLKSKGLQSYFSCNPANINIDRTIEMFESGLNYIKYSIESVDDSKHKEIRGSHSNFTQSYERICKLLDLKRKHGYETTIVITMLDLNQTHQTEDYAKLRKAFDGLDVYIYLKSEDQQWYRKDYHGTNSIHWSEICKHPWMSTTIKSNGEVAMCMEDFNNEIILGNITDESLYNIWNGDKYHQFRIDHAHGLKGMKCIEQCDMKVAGECRTRR